MSYNPELLIAFKMLGFQQPTSWEEVKKAYHTLVIKHHPDKGGNPKQFRQIQEAYEQLQQVMEGEKQNNKSSSNFIHNRDPKCNDIQFTLEMTLEDLFNGRTVTTLIDYDQICPVCRGQGHPPHLKPTPCPNCRNQDPQRGNCALCEGSGYCLNQHQRCHRCAGIKIIKDRKKIQVKIPPGVNQNDRMQMLHQGNQYPNKRDGHIFIVIKEKRHSIYTRRGNDLIINRTINLADALSGYPITLPTLDGQTLTLQTNTPVLPGSVRKVPGQGMPMRQNPKRRGNLLIQFQIQFPKQICPADQKEQLGEILKQPTTSLLPNPKLI